MRNAPRLAPQLAQNGSFCANYKRKYCASKLTHSPHTLASPNGSWDCSLLRFSLSSVSLYSAVALSLERGSLFGCGSLSLRGSLFGCGSLSRRGSLFGCGSLSHRGSLSFDLTHISLLSPSAFSCRGSLSRISLGNQFVEVIGLICCWKLLSQIVVGSYLLLKFAAENC